jgi:hypothetical protein
MFQPLNFSGRPVQILQVRPALVLDLIRDLDQHKLFIPNIHRDKLDEAQVVACQEVNGLIWLYLEKTGWSVIRDGDVPCLRHQYIQADGEPQSTRDWGKPDQFLVSQSPSYNP